MQADAVHGWGVQGLGGATYRKVGSALHGFQSAIAAFLPCHTTLYLRAVVQELEGGSKSNSRGVGGPLVKRA